MAELHVQPKKRSSNTWIWVLVALLIIGAAAYYFLTQNKQETENKENVTNATSLYFQASNSIMKIV